jgi:O-antigen/teichoic acid export membrane protein
MAASLPATPAAHEVDRTDCFNVPASVSDPTSERFKSVRTTASIPAADDSPLRVDETGVELKRGMFFNAIAMLASNFRGLFNLLVAWLLGPAALGMFSIAWAVTDILSKIGIFGLDNAITTFIARSEAAGDRARSRTLFRLAGVLALAQSAIIAVASIFVIRLLGGRLHLQPEMVSAIAIVLCAMPGVALYRISIAVSQGMKVMQHDIYSRGVTEPIVMALAFLIALAIGFKAFGPELALIVGTAASGVVAFTLASKLFRHVPAGRGAVSLRSELRQLLNYAAPISAHQLLATFIAQLDLIILGCFIGRTPGVTLVTVGIYGAVVGTANGLRKITQVFNPIFAPVAAGMTAAGDHERAAETYARLSQWLLWVLLPFVAMMTLAGPTILMIYGPAFREGGAWLGIVAVAYSIYAFVSLGETAIMVQRPRLNLLHSLITGAVAFGGNIWLIPRLGVMGAAVSIFLAYAVQAALRCATLRFVFRWKQSWNDISPPVVAAIIAFVPAIVFRVLLDGIAAQLTSAVAFLVVFGLGWWRHHVQSRTYHL